MLEPIHAIDCVKCYTITRVGTYSCNQLCEKSDYYSCGNLFMQSIVIRIRNIIVHLMILFIICVLDCMNKGNRTIAGLRYGKKYLFCPRTLIFAPIKG